jgi:hypothetical protein
VLLIPSAWQAKRRLFFAQGADGMPHLEQGTWISPIGRLALA